MFTYTNKCYLKHTLIDSNLPTMQYAYKITNSLLNRFVVIETSRYLRDLPHSKNIPDTILTGRLV